MRPKLLVLIAFIPLAGHAAAIYSVSLATSPLIGHPAGPFSLEFQLNDGSGSGDANNTATLSDFDFHGGNVPGSPIRAGGASGNLLAGVSLTDSSFFNEFIQGFAPGSSLSFQISLTTNPDPGGTPDEFSFSILDNTSVEIPTLDVTDTLILIDITSSNPTVNTFATDPNSFPRGGGNPIVISAPDVAEVETVPEPATILLMGSAVLALLAARTSSGSFRLRTSLHRPNAARQTPAR